jgi:hypothetical protein
MSETQSEVLPRLRLYRILSAVAIVAAAGAGVWQQITRADGDPELWVNSARTLLAGGDIYTTPSPHGNFYYYPPFFDVVVIPLLPIPVPVVAVLWGIASVLILGYAMAAFYSGMRATPFFDLPARERWTVMFLATLATARFTVLHFRFGQVNILVLGLVVFGLTRIAVKKEVTSGIALGFSIAIKLLTLPFAVWFATRLKAKVLAGILLAGSVACVLPSLIVGPTRNLELHREWVERVVLGHAPGTGEWSNSGNVSPRAQIDRFFTEAPAFMAGTESRTVTLTHLPPTAVRLLGYSVMFAVILLICFYSIRFRRTDPLISEWGGYALVFSLIPLFSPVSEIPHLVLLAPAYIYVLHLWCGAQLKDRTFRALVVLSFILLTLTTKTFWGEYLSRLYAALGLITVGLVMLSAAIVRAAYCLSVPRLPTHVSSPDQVEGLTSSA